MSVTFACRSNKYCAWLVQSSKKHMFYLVEFDSNPQAPNFRDNWHCECPAFQHRTFELCKHIRAKESQKCNWDQAKQTNLSTAPVRKNDGQLLCPVCEGDVYAYIPPVPEDAEF